MRCNGKEHGKGIAMPRVGCRFISDRLLCLLRGWERIRLASQLAVGLSEFGVFD